MKEAEEVFVDLSLRGAADATLGGSYDRAIEILRRLLNSRPELPGAKDLLGRIYARQGKYEEAIKQWEEVLKAEPENYEAKKAIEKAEKLKNLRDRGGFYGIYFRQRLFMAASGVLFVALIVGFYGFPRASKPVPQEVVYKVEKMDVKSLSASPKKVPEEIRIEIEAIKSAMKNKQDFVFLSITFRAEEDKLFVYGRVPTLYLYERVIEFLKNFPEVKAIDTTGVTITGQYLVGKGESLRAIARKLYGTSQRWKDIYQQNKGLIKLPDTIFYGTELKVPIK